MSKLGLLVFLLPFCSAGQTPAPDAVNEWIRGSAIRLTTPVAGHGFEDMQPLKKVVGDARIVALGEATHGTREFFQLKHRMLEFLATQMGFAIFSIEANMPEAYRLNDFVLNGVGDPVKLIKGMYFWTWDTEEVLDMVLWMREFNKSGKGRVAFTGFDMQTPTVANEIVRDFVNKNDAEFVPELAKASSMALAPTGAQQSPFGTAAGIFPVEPALGKTIRFSGYIKTDTVTGYAGFWWRADVNGKPASFRNLGEAAPKGTVDWWKYELELPVPANATAIYFGPLLSGGGTAWFDDFQIEIDGKPYVSEAFDFTFEGPTLKGLGAGMPAFPVRLDSHEAHGGKQSLRISHVEAPVNPNAVDPKLAAAEWTGVMKHLNDSQERYEKNASKHDVEWAIQNARVVLQCMQMRANQITRDASMAANVKWILDQSPGARIVLWAHNGHVGTGGQGSMGDALRKMYGDQMVTFGFSFNEGSFQAIPQNGGGLRDFTVSPAPVGSLDATLAASGIPLFALDLRAAPKTGTVADWWNTAHATRSIGAVYAEGSPTNYMASWVAPSVFNVMLFVDKTTAARKNVVPAILFQPETGRSGEYRDPEFPVSLKLPPGWKMGEVVRWGDHQNTVPLISPDRAAAGSLYFTTNRNPNSSLEGSPAAKARERVSEGLGDYQVRLGSIERKLVEGRAAISCVADFTQNGDKMVEYLTWVRGETALALFFARTSVADLDGLQKRLDPIIETLKLP